MREIIRTFRFAPYARGQGPTFTLRVYDIHTRDHRGVWMTGYCLQAHPVSGKSVTLFDANDHSCLAAIDSEETANSIMGFLTLRPGDTDADYFAKYTPEQLAFCEEDAESLACAVSDKWADPETGFFDPKAARAYRRKQQRLYAKGGAR